MKGMVLTERDIALLRYLHAVKISTFQRIKREIFPDYHLKSVCNRVYRLENNGLVRGWCNRRIENGERLIALTKKGFADFVADGGEMRAELSSDSTEHDLALGEIRSLLLAANRVSTYHTENQLQTWGKTKLDPRLAPFVDLNCDGLATLKFADEHIFAPIEYDATLKGHDRYCSLLKRYYQHDDVLLIIFIASKTDILNRVSDIERQIFPSNEPKFVYALLENLRQDAQVSFKNCNGDVLLLNQC